MIVRLSDPAYTDRLAAFLTSVGQAAVATAPDRVRLEAAESEAARAELAIYLNIWLVLHPDAPAELLET